MTSSNEQVWLPDYIYTDGRFVPNLAIVCDDSGRIVRLAPATNISNAQRLKNCAILPGLVNAHSHAFQRVIRGRTEYRSPGIANTFWTWRQMMYSAANKLTPEDLYTSARMAFLEMALTGITTVGEFHYFHNSPDGSPYSDPNLLAKEVIRAAGDVGIRIALLRVAYVRAGYQQELNPQQLRFIEDPHKRFFDNADRLLSELKKTDDMAWMGVAPHSVRAVPLDFLREVISYATEQDLPVHMHVAEQPAEVSACIEEYGRSPVALLETEGLLSKRFTAVHAIYVTAKAIAALARQRANVCACPTTERNLGDGIVPADAYFNAGVPLSLGTDSQVQIDLLEDARALEYHLRLQKNARNVLAPEEQDQASALAARLFDCATIRGAESLSFNGGAMTDGTPADFFSVDLADPSIAGATVDDLLSTIVFSMSRSAIQDVFVGGIQIISNGRHPKQEEIVSNFTTLQQKLWL